MLSWWNINIGWRGKRVVPNFVSFVNCLFTFIFIIFKKVNEVLAKVDPNDLQDIASDDEDEEQFATNDIQTTDGKCQYFNYFQKKIFIIFIY